MLGVQSESRGLKSEGKLARQLQEQKKDGGRAEEARREAEQRGERLVVSRHCSSISQAEGFADRRCCRWQWD